MPASRPRRPLVALLVALPLALAFLPTALADHRPEGIGCSDTPGGWGAVPRGHNTGAFLHTHFDDVFGAALVVGDEVFEDAQEVTDRLPTGVKLLDHAVALEINLEFGKAGLMDGTIEGVVVPSGPYAGWTAEELLQEAEEALIADPDPEESEYSALIDAMAGFNQGTFGCGVPCPDNVTAAPAADGVVLTWDEVDAADAYRVYRATGDGAFVQLAQTANTTYTDTTAAPGVTYRYMVTALDGELESEGCDAVMTTAIPFFPGLIGAALAVVGGVGAFAWLRRGRASGG